MNPLFSLDPRLQHDSIFIAHLTACQLRLMDDARWLWLILIPEIEGATELHLLSPAMRNNVMNDLYQSSHLLQQLRPQSKINIGALGNIVRQLHIHVIARLVGDANWPGPVWGYGERVPLPELEQQNRIEAIRHALRKQ